jgi:hypothetical protein
MAAKLPSAPRRPTGKSTYGKEKDNNDDELGAPNSEALQMQEADTTLLIKRAGIKIDPETTGQSRQRRRLSGTWENRARCAVANSTNNVTQRADMER